MSKRVKLICFTSVMTALVFVFTAYLHVPAFHGYVHAGDAFIYLAACFLPRSYAVFTGSFGAALADCLTGYTLWAPASVIIKAVTALLFSCKGKMLVNKRNLWMLLPATLLCAGGYYIYETILYGNALVPLSSVGGSLIQSAVSGVLFVTLGVALDRKHMKERILGGN